jgi:hypothetical protein
MSYDQQLTDALSDARQLREDVETLRCTVSVQEREIARLSARTHEIQAREMGKRAELEARLAYYDNLRDSVRLRLSSVGPGSSIYDHHTAIELAAQLQAARVELDDLHQQIEQGESRS